MPSNHDLEQRLSPQARAILDSLMDEVREQVVATAGRASVQLGERHRLISASDIIEAFDAQRLFDERTQQQQSRIWRISYFYLLLTTVLAAIAAAATVFLDFSMDSDVLAAIGTAAVALLASSFAFFQYARVREDRSIELRLDTLKVSYDDLLLHFMSSWLDLEATLQASAASELGESRSGLPLSVSVKELERTGRITEEEATRIRRLLSFRNDVVHEGQAPNRDVLLNAIQEASTITAALSRPQ